MFLIRCLAIPFALPIALGLGLPTQKTIWQSGAFRREFFATPMT